MEKYLENLDKNQIKAVIDIDNPCRIIAGPGSGKTRTIVAKYIYLILEKQYKPENIALLTFTNKATDEIKERVLGYLDVNKIEYDLNNLRISTIHSFCKKLIDDHKQEIVGNFIATNVLDEISQGAFILSFIEDYGYFSKVSACKTVYEEIVPFFNKISDENLDIKTVYDYLNRKLLYIFQKKKRTGIELRNTIKEVEKIKNLINLCTVYEEYQNKLKERLLIDFSNLQKFLLNEIENNEDLLRKIREEIKYIIVDEYQDTSFLQSEILLKIAEPEYNITICGDDDQGLYRFRGATVNNFLEFANRIDKRVKNYYLITNYRSSIEIVKNTQLLIENNIGFRFSKELESNKTETGICDIIEASNPEDEAKIIILVIKLLYEEKIIRSMSDITILFRSVLYHSKEIINELDKNEIPYIVYGTDKLGSSINARSFLEILSFVSGKTDTIKINENEFFIEEDENEFDINENNLSEYDNKLNITDYQYLEILIEVRNNIKEYKSNISIFYDLIENSPFFKALISNENYGKLGEIAFISQIIKKIDLSYQKTDPYLVDSIFRNLSIKGDVIKEKYMYQGKINIMTIHQSKGLEFPFIIIPSLYKRKRKESITSYLSELFYYETSDKEKIEEIDERKLIYVGMTRALDGVLLSYPGKKKWGTGYINATPINPISEIPKPISNIKNICEILPKVKINSIKVKKENKKLILSFSRIRTYIECPRKYNLMYNLEFATVLEGQMVFGLSIHRSLEEIHSNYIKNKKSTYTVVEMRKIVDKNWIDITYKKRETKKYKETAISYLLQYTINEAKNFRYILKTELPFQIDVKNEHYLLNGVIDLVSRKEHEIEITDFKVNQIDDPIYDYQMYLYAYCYEKAFKEKPQKLRLYSMKNSRYREIKFDEKTSNRFYENFSKIISNIKEENFINKPGSNCNYCPYKNFCNDLE